MFMLCNNIITNYVFCNYWFVVCVLQCAWLFCNKVRS